MKIVRLRIYTTQRSAAVDKFELILLVATIVCFFLLVVLRAIQVHQEKKMAKAISELRELLEFNALLEKSEERPVFRNPAIIPTPPTPSTIP